MKFVKFLWKKWLVVAQAIGNFQAQVILTVFYLSILLPLGVLFIIFADPFNLRRKLTSNFVKWEHIKENVKEARRQY